MISVPAVPRSKRDLPGACKADYGQLIAAALLTCGAEARIAPLWRFVHRIAGHVKQTAKEVRA